MPKRSRKFLSRISLCCTKVEVHRNIGNFHGTRLCMQLSSKLNTSHRSKIFYPNSRQEITTVQRMIAILSLDPIWRIWRIHWRSLNTIGANKTAAPYTAIMDANELAKQQPSKQQQQQKDKPILSPRRFLLYNLLPTGSLKLQHGLVGRGAQDHFDDDGPGHGGLWSALRAMAKSVDLLTSFARTHTCCWFARCSYLWILLKGYAQIW